jgi:hypothetical protein
MNKLNEVRQFQKIAGIKEDDYSEDPFSDVYNDSESGDTATMGNINEEGSSITINIPEDTSYMEFAKAVASELKSGYGKHLYKDFLKVLVAELAH